MTRLRQNFVGGTVDDNPLGIAATTLTSSELAGLQAITAPEIAVLVLDPDAAAPEIVYVTAHTAAATTATIARGKEGSAAAEHALDTPWKHVPTAEDFRIYSAGTTLSNHVPTNTTMEQWGTEEAVFAQEVCPTDAVVIATVTGSAEASGGSAVAGDRGEIRLEVSFDGGSSWVTCGDSGTIVTFALTGAGKRFPVVATGRVTGTVTGDVQVRAMIRDVDGAGDTSWADGSVTALIHPS